MQTFHTKRKSHVINFVVSVWTISIIFKIIAKRTCASWAEGGHLFLFIAIKHFRVSENGCQELEVRHEKWCKTKQACKINRRKEVVSGFSIHSFSCDFIDFLSISFIRVLASCTWTASSAIFVLITNKFQVHVIPRQYHTKQGVALANYQDNKDLPIFKQVIVKQSSHL